MARECGTIWAPDVTIGNEPEASSRAVFAALVLRLTKEFVLDCRPLS